ncbi:hypothetical protein [uncultured Subdoligranulum sp.]|uniref:hypothetical protein n=1 Tax=uncultured Subdoligranulum sp. TaxID=512298 RepID=UPI0025FA7293|nr:hypothetical protein [uncultured Subdoligranulum sp.]
MPGTGEEEGSLAVEEVLVAGVGVGVDAQGAILKDAVGEQLQYSIQPKWASMRQRTATPAEWHRQSRLCRVGSRQIPIEILTGICYYFPWNHGTLEPSRFCAVSNLPGSQQSGNRARFGQAPRGGPQFVMPGREESKGSVVYGTEKDGPCQKAGG